MKGRGSAAIAPHVSAEGVRLDDGAVVALLPENSEQVSAAVAKLLNREKPVKESRSDRSTHCSSVAKRWRRGCPDWTASWK